MLIIKLALSVLVLTVLVAGCLPATALVLPANNVPVSVNFRGVQISSLPPTGWRAFVDGTHLILTNQPNDRATPTVVLNIWMPAEELIRDIPKETGTSTAEVLREITNTPRLIGNAIASTPEPFRWMQYDGAYYVLNTGTDSVTLVIALTPADASQMIVINITTDRTSLNNLQRVAGAALESVLINQQPLSAELFSMLPQPLEIPTPQGVNEPS
ncbi:MAG: hypothetical protein SNJ54_04380 [Anaerolineae bacterium]